MSSASHVTWCRLHRLALAGLLALGAAAPAIGEDASALARELLRRSETRRGVCAAIGITPELAVELATTSELLLHVRDPRDAVVAEIRRRAAEVGLGIDRLAVERGGTLALPYADHLIDAIFVFDAGDDGPPPPPPAELVRVLRPQGKALVLGNDARRQELIRWAQQRELLHVEFWGSTRKWVELHKPAMKGADDWSHWERGPDNNPVSADQVIRAPYMTQYLAGPLYIGMPAVTTAAAGRLFLAIGHIAHHEREWDTLNTLIARNGYNGTVLWKRKLPEGYLVHRSAFIATDDTFYMIGGDGCLLLDPETGKQKGSISIPDVEGEWKWMARRDGVLYAMLGAPDPGARTTLGNREFGGWSWSDLSPGYYGRRIPHGFGHTVVAWDLENGKLLWKHRESSPIDSRALALDAKRLYVYCPDRHFRALSADSGEVAWTNADTDVLELIEMPGRRLRSTPGFRTACIAVATPDALIVQGQTRMNVVALATSTGYFLWSKKKITNNPNAIFVDGKVILGVGEDASHVAIDPVSGEVAEDLKFTKANCTRLTASSDSFFCRGEGTLRFDRATKRVLVDGAIRPACNDGAIPANGMLYLGPWQCDCNLSLIGHVAKCSAGDFSFDRVATTDENLERASGELEVTPLEVTARDWPTYRGDDRRSGSTPVEIARNVVRRWRTDRASAFSPTAPVAAGALVLVAGDDGRVRALESDDGSIAWQFETPSPIKAPPTIWDGRAYVGSGDGHVYALEASTGRLLWRFRAAPVERHIAVYGAIASTWPVNSGVLVHDGVAYCAAGIIDSDGTYLYALDAKTGEIRWQNGSTGHLDATLRKGVSAMGNLTIDGDRLYLAGGNQLSPAPFDAKTGKLDAEFAGAGWPRSNSGRFVGVFQDGTVIGGGRTLYSAAENVATKGSFAAHARGREFRLCWGGVPPAWNDETLVLVNYRHGKLLCFDSERVAARLARGAPGDRPRQWRANLADVLAAEGALRWSSDLDEPNKFETVSLAVAPNAVVAVVRQQHKFRSQPQWHLAALDARTGDQVFKHELRGDPLPDGLLVDRDGRIVVVMLDGSVEAWGP